MDRQARSDGRLHSTTWSFPSVRAAMASCWIHPDSSLAGQPTSQSHSRSPSRHMAQSTCFSNYLSKSPVGATIPITDTHHTHVQIIRQPRLPYTFWTAWLTFQKSQVRIYVVKKVEWEMRLYMCTRTGLLHV